MQAISILLAGLAIGWLTGLSASPVISGILASLLGIGAGAVAGLKNLSRAGGAGPRQLDARPAALLVLGIALGAPLGILARTHHIFEPARSAESRTEKPLDATDRGVLFSVTTEQCAELLALAKYPNPQAFRDAVRNSSLPQAQALADRIPDTESLRAAVEALCQGNSSP